MHRGSLHAVHQTGERVCRSITSFLLNLHVDGRLLFTVRLPVRRQAPVIRCKRCLLVRIHQDLGGLTEAGIGAGMEAQCFRAESRSLWLGAHLDEGT